LENVEEHIAHVDGMVSEDCLLDLTKAGRDKSDRIDRRALGLDPYNGAYKMKSFREPFLLPCPFCGGAFSDLSYDRRIVFCVRGVRLSTHVSRIAIHWKKTTIRLNIKML
jgi:hypothetical protein